MIIGVAYPAFMSFRALETVEEDDDKQWLTYWVCYGFFNIVDQFAGIILQFIPFYYFLKLGFLIYLFHPQTLGAMWVYKNVIMPHVEKYKDQIDAAEKQVSDMANKGSNLMKNYNKKE